jgi:hypothetical protein
MSDQSESLGSVWRVLQTAIQFYFQFKMNRRLAGKQNKAGEAQARKAQQRLFKARSNAAGELFGKQPFQFTGLQSDMYYFLPNDRLSLQYVKNIPDAKLQSNVMDVLKSSEKQGLIKYDPRFDDFYVTENGLNWLCDKSNVNMYKEYMSAYRKHEGVTHMSPEEVAEGAVKAESGVAKVNGATSAKAVQGTTAQASQVGASQAVSSATVATAQTTAQAAGQATAQAAAGAAPGGASAAATVAASVAKGIVSSAAQSSAPSPAPTMTMTMK